MKIPFLTFIFLILSTAVICLGCGSSKSDINTDDPEKAFSIAKRKFDKGDYTDAIEDFSFIKLRFPGTAISEKTQFYLAYSYYRQKEYILAAYEFDKFLRSYPRSEMYPDAMYMLGLAYYELSPAYPVDQEYTYLALEQFQRFIESYPEHRSSADAEKKITELRNKIAYKDYKTAEIYLKNDNYRAASIYFRNVYDNYIESEWADDAMIGEAEAYISAKKYSEAESVLEKFLKLFPNSQLKPKAQKLLSDIKLEQGKK